MTRTISFTIAGFFCFMAFGCSVINPYNSEFSCPAAYKGKCSDIKEAYNDSLTNKDVAASEAHKKHLDDKAYRKKGGSADENGSDSSCETCGGSSETCEEGSKNCTKGKKTVAAYDDMYKQSLYSELKKLIDDPKTPVVKPPKVMRILFLGYTDSENQYLSYRYGFVFVEEPKWVISPVEEVKE